MIKLAKRAVVIELDTPRIYRFHFSRNGSVAIGNLPSVAPSFNHSKKENIVRTTNQKKDQK